MTPRLPRRQSKFILVGIIWSLERLLYRRVIVPLVAFFPARLAYGMACLHGDWSYRLDKAARKQIIFNLESIFGDQLSPAERTRVARDLFRRRDCQFIDAVRLAGSGRALMRLVEIHGLEYIKAALAAGKGAVICYAHFGSYMSCCTLLGAYGFPITAVGDLKSNPILSLLGRIFQRSGVAKCRPRHLRRPNIEPLKGQVEAAIQMAEVLRGNEVITIAIDVPVSLKDRAHAVLVDFLGRQVQLLPGSVSISQHTGAQVLVLVARRSPDWRHQIIEISPVALDGDIETDFKRCIALVEAPIRQNPALWDGCLNPQALINFGLLGDSIEKPL